MTHILEIFLRKSHDQIHIDIIKAQTSRQLKTLNRLFYRMMTANDIKCLLFHRLRIDGNTTDSIVAQHLQLFLCDRIRASGFHSKLDAAAQIKTATDFTNQAIQLIWLQCRRCSSTDINGIQFLMIILYCHIVDFFLQRIQICIHLLFPGCQRIRSKRAVQTCTRAKWNSDIQAVSIFIIELRKKRTLTLCDCDG